MLFVGLLLLRTLGLLASYSSTGRVELANGGDFEFTHRLWSSLGDYDTNGQAIDVWNTHASVTVVQCRFENVNSVMQTGGTFNWQWITLNLSQCDFVQCSSGGQAGWYGQSDWNGILISNNGTSDVWIDDCLFDNCQAWSSGGIIYLSSAVDTYNNVNITNCRFRACKVGVLDTYNRLDALITCTWLDTFTFSNNTLWWEPTQPAPVRSSALLRVAFANESMDPLIDGLSVVDTTFPEGLILHQNETKSVTYREFRFETVRLGNETFQAGLLPEINVDTVMLVDCQFSDCWSRDGFVDTSIAVINTVTLDSCRFSECKCNESNGFLFFSGNADVKVMDCYFGNIRFFDEENAENSAPYHLVAAQRCQKVFVSLATFDLPKLSTWNIDIYMNQADIEFQVCTFVVEGDLSVSQLLFENPRSVRMDTCTFTVDSNTKPNTTPMVQFKGLQSTEVGFYNCCFEHNFVQKPTASAIYLALEGKGVARFENTCFDSTQEDGIENSAEVSLITDSEHMFGNCLCNISGPVHTIEPLTDEPSSPTDDDSNGGIPAGVLTGIIFGLLILIIILVILILFFLWRRRRTEKSSTDEEVAPVDAPEETITTIDDSVHATLDGATNDNPLFAEDVSVGVFDEQFEEKSFL